MAAAKFLSLILAFSLLIALSRAQCSPIYGQCGGSSWTGPTCCEQPQYDPLYVASPTPTDAVICQFSNDFYSQCVPRCPQDKPCFERSSGTCKSSGALGTDGRGRQFCGPNADCTSAIHCFTNNDSCICADGVPCRIDASPGGCTALSSTGDCPAGSTRCPAFAFQPCAGIGCQPGLTCVTINDFTSQCQPQTA